MIKIFDNFKKQCAGVWYFSPEDEAAFKKGLPTKGFGSIKYPEGSLYTGEIYFDGENYNKLGFGKQEFYTSEISAFKSEINARIASYVGQFDYRVTDWIFGNGVLYFADEYFKPKFWVKGFYLSLDKVGEYKGKFDLSTLMPGYAPEMESDVSLREMLIKKELSYVDGTCENLFLGDSYFECWFYDGYSGQKTFYDLFERGKNVNFGLGGSTFAEWLYRTELLKKVNVPKRVFINLGFNDLHFKKNAASVIKDRNEFMKVLLGEYSGSEIYMFNVAHAPCFQDLFDIENEYNEDLAKYALSIGAHVVDYSGKLDCSCFHSDAVHPNEKGYTIMKKLIDENIKS